MSIGNIGSYAPASLGQTLSSLLSQLGSNNSASTAFAPESSSSQPATNNSLTGPATPALSSQILGVLMMMQQDPGSQATASTSQSPTDPLQQLVSAMDTDGDGSVSQTEMESYIEQKGGTQAQADTLFTSLNQNGTGNLTTAQLSSDLQQARGAHHGHHHHHHSGGTDQQTSPLLQALDTSNAAAQSPDDAANTPQTASTSSATPASSTSSLISSLFNDLQQGASLAGTLLMATA